MQEKRLDEKCLIEQMLAGHKSAWVKFVRDYQSLVQARIARTAYQYSAKMDRSDCDDVCAEVFAQLVANNMSSLRGFKGNSSLATWLCVIARRACLKYILRHPTDRSIGFSTCESDPVNLLPEKSENGLASMISKEKSEQLEGLLKRLGPGDQRILELHFTDQLSYQDISHSMRISVNAVGPKLHRAQTRLRQLARRFNEPQ